MSHNWRGLRSSEGQSREAFLISSARSAATMGFTRVPPWGAMRL